MDRIGYNEFPHDPAANVAYIRFRERQGDVETIRLTDDVLVDIDQTGAVCGVELLNPAGRSAARDDGGPAGGSAAEPGPAA